MQRSAAIRKIEQDMIQLGQLYQEVADLIHQQEPAVAQINQGAEETHTYVQQANTKLDTAITSARNARRWKWYALIIVGKCYLCLSIWASADHLQSSSLPLSSVWPSVSPSTTATPNKPSASPFLFCTTCAGSDSSWSISYPSLPFVTIPSSRSHPLVSIPPRMSYLLSCVKAMFVRLLSPCVLLHGCVQRLR